VSLPFGTWLALDQVVSIVSDGVIDPTDVLVDEQRKMLSRPCPSAVE
jgi:hypothetical protein